MYSGLIEGGVLTNYQGPPPPTSLTFRHYREGKPDNVNSLPQHLISKLQSQSSVL